MAMVWVVIASSFCVGAAWSARERTTRQISSGSIDLNHPIDDPLVKTTFTVGSDPKGTLETWGDRESDFEREKRREMEIAWEREKERRSLQKKEHNTMSEELVSRSRTNEKEGRRESDRQAEITREINKAEARKKAILLETALPDRLINKFSSLRNTEEHNRSEQNLQRQIDRALRGGDDLERTNSKLVRDTLREDGVDDWRHTELEPEHRHHHIPRRPPILIIEQIPVRYSGSTTSDHFPETHFKKPQDEGSNDPEVWDEGSVLPENDHRIQAVGLPHSQPHVDPRAPDRPVALPRPNTTYTDRRPDRHDYPYKYDEIRISIPGDLAEHQAELFDEHHNGQTIPLPARDDLTHGQGFPIPGVVPNPSLDLYAPYIPPHHVHGLGIASHSNAANTQLALKQALIAEQALRAQSIQAGKIKQAAVAAHLVGQVAAQQLAAQQAAAQKITAQLIAAGSASARRKAAQIGQIIAGNAAIRAAQETDHHLKELISPKPAAKLLSGAGVEVQLGDAGVTTPLATNHFQQHHRFFSGNQQSTDHLREELIHRLTILK